MKFPLKLSPLALSPYIKSYSFTPGHECVGGSHVTWVLNRKSLVTWNRECVRFWTILVLAGELGMSGSTEIKNNDILKLCQL